MLADQLCRLGRCLLDQGVSLGLCIGHDGILVADDLLIPLDLIRCLQAELS